MGERHCAFHHFAAALRKSAALNEIGAFAKLSDEPGNFPEVITVIRVSHQDELAARRGYATHQRIPVTLLFDVDDASPQTSGYRHGLVRASVVRDNDLARDIF